MFFYWDRQNQDRIGPDHGPDHGSDHRSDHRKKNKVLKKKNPKEWNRL